VSRSGNSRPLHQSSATYLTVPERSSSNHSYQNGYASSPPVPDNSFNSSSGYEEVFSQPQLPQHEQQLPLQQQQQHGQQLSLQQQQHEQQLPLQQQHHEQQLPLQQQQQQHSDYPTHYSPSVIQTVPYLSPSQPVKEASPSRSAFPSGGGVEQPQLYTRPCQGSLSTSSAGVGTTGGGGTNTVNGSSERDPVARNAGKGEMLRGEGAIVTL